MANQRMHATGKIAVKTYEQTPYDQPGKGPVLSRIHVGEEFSGDIEAMALTSRSITGSSSHDAGHAIGQCAGRGS
jgi:hypothetical protein